MNNTDRFLELYNELDNLLRKRYNELSRTTSVIVRYINDLNRSGNPALIKYAKKLNTIRKLRNDIIHEYDNNLDNFLVINDDCINFLKNLVEILRNPRTAKNLITPLEELYVIKYNDEILVKDIMKEMRRLGHSQVPVVDAFHIVIGMFTPNVLFSYLENNVDVNIETLTLKDIKEYIPLKNHFSESYEFISINTSETEVDELFYTSYQNNKKLAVALVTKRGTEKEPLLGIIVEADIIKK